MSQIIKAQWTERLHFGAKYGTLELLLDEYSTDIYQQAGAYFYAVDGDFVSIYEFQPGTTRGFAGREIVLQMTDGTQKAFRGSLWDPTNEIKNKKVPRSRRISVTTEAEVMERGYTFYSARLRLARYVELRAELGVPVSFNDVR